MSAVEFALILPIFITLLIGGFELSQGSAAMRKVTTTTRTVADLVARTNGNGLSASDMSNILNASAQVMAPFPTSKLTIVVTQFQAAVDPLAAATVVWSTALNGTALTKGSKVTLQAGVVQSQAYIIRADVTYIYPPPIGSTVVGTFTLKNSLYMSPRQVASITYTGS